MDHVYNSITVFYDVYFDDFITELVSSSMMELK